MTTMRLANFQKAVNNTTTHYPIYIYIYTRTQVLRLEKRVQHSRLFYFSLLTSICRSMLCGCALPTLIQ